MAPDGAYLVEEGALQVVRHQRGGLVFCRVHVGAALHSLVHELVHARLGQTAERHGLRIARSQLAEQQRRCLLQKSRGFLGWEERESEATRAARRSGRRRLLAARGEARGEPDIVVGVPRMARGETCVQHVVVGRRRRRGEERSEELEHGGERGGRGRGVGGAEGVSFAEQRGGRRRGREQGREEGRRRWGGVGEGDGEGGKRTSAVGEEQQGDGRGAVWFHRVSMKL